MIFYNLEYLLKCFPHRFRRFLDNQFKNEPTKFKKTDKKMVEIGSFNNAKLIGIAFPKCPCKKDRIHTILNGSNFYPKSIIVSRENIIENKKEIKNMLENYSTVLKKCVSSGGNDVFIVNSMEDIKNKMKNGSYILQKIIDPYLFISRKFDFRLYILYIREENNYFAYTVKNGFARIGINAYKKNSQDTFITNVISLTKNKIQKQKHFVYYDSIIEHIKKEEKKNIEDDIINCLANVAKKQLPFIIKHNNSFFQNKNKPKYQFWLVGADIILDNNLNPFVLELNAEPGLVSEQNEHNHIMMNYCWEYIFSNWIDNKSNRCNELKYFIKLAEKN